MVALFGPAKIYSAFLNGRLLRRRIDFRHILQPLADAQVAGVRGGANSGVPQLFEKHAKCRGGRAAEAALPLDWIPSLRR